MVVIGVDPHKSSHTAAALDPGAHTTLGTVRIEAALPEYRKLLVWARRFGERRWAVENAWGLGRHLAQRLIARGETVVDVPSTATARVRQLSWGGRRKNDALDAAAAASVAALQGDGVPVAAEGASTVLGMLDERRTNLAQQRPHTIPQHDLDYDHGSDDERRNRRIASVHGGHQMAVLIHQVPGCNHQFNVDIGLPSPPQDGVTGQTVCWQAPYRTGPAI